MKCGKCTNPACPEYGRVYGSAAPRLVARCPRCGKAMAGVTLAEATAGVDPRRYGTYPAGLRENGGRRLEEQERCLCNGRSKDLPAGLSLASNLPGMGCGCLDGPGPVRRISGDNFGGRVPVANRPGKR